MAKQSPKDPKFRCNICKEYYHAPEHPVHYQCAIHGYLCEKHIGKEEDLIYCHTFNKKHEEEYEEFKKISDKAWGEWRVVVDDNHKFKRNLPLPEIPRDPHGPRTDLYLINEDPYYDKKYPLPTELVGKCMCEAPDNKNRRYHYRDEPSKLEFIFPYKAESILKTELANFTAKEKEKFGYDGLESYYNPYVNNYIKALDSSIKDLVFRSKNKYIGPGRLDQCLKDSIKYTWNDNIKRWLEVGKDKEEDFIKDVKVKSNQKAGNPEIKLLVDLFEKNVLTKDQFLIQLKEILKF